MPVARGWFHAYSEKLANEKLESNIIITGAHIYMKAHRLSEGGIHQTDDRCFL